MTLALLGAIGAWQLDSLPPTEPYCGARTWRGVFSRPSFFFSSLLQELTSRFFKVGPGTNNHNPKQDSGKFAPAASTTGYRQVGSASGPNSSQGEYTATQDIGKQMPAGGDGQGYRLNTTTSVAGPSASGTDVHSNLDPGHNQFLSEGGTN